MRNWVVLLIGFWFCWFPVGQAQQNAQEDSGALDKQQKLDYFRCVFAYKFIQEAPDLYVNRFQCQCSENSPDFQTLSTCIKQTDITRKKVYAPVLIEFLQHLTTSDTEEDLQEWIQDSPELLTIQGITPEKIQGYVEYANEKSQFFSNSIFRKSNFMLSFFGILILGLLAAWFLKKQFWKSVDSISSQNTKNELKLRLQNAKKHFPGTKQEKSETQKTTVPPITDKKPEVAKQVSEPAILISKDKPTEPPLQDTIQPNLDETQTISVTPKTDFIPPPEILKVIQTIYSSGSIQENLISGYDTHSPENSFRIEEMNTGEIFIFASEHTDFKDFVRQDLERRLLPVCDFENIPGRFFTKIQTIKPGRLQKEGSHFRMIQKAVVRFVD